MAAALVAAPLGLAALARAYDWYPGNGAAMSGESPDLYLPTPELLALCGELRTVKQTGGGDYGSIQGALNNLPPTLSTNTCVVVIDSSTYSESLTVQNLNTNGYRLRLMSDPALPYQPILAPFMPSAAAVSVFSSSVTVDGFRIIPANSLDYGILASSDNIIISDVSMASDYAVQQAGIALSSWSLVENTSMTVISGHGIWLRGANSAVRHSTFTANTSSRYALYLQGASSNTVSDVFVSNLAGYGAFLNNNSDNNTVTRSTLTSGGMFYEALWLSFSSSNTFSRSYIGNTFGSGAYLGTQARFTTITDSTLHGVGINRYALHVLEGSSNTVTNSKIYSREGTGVYIYGNAVGNNVAASTITSVQSESPAFVIGAASTTVADCYVQGSTAIALNSAPFTMIRGSVLVSTWSAGVGMSVSNTLGGMFVTSSTISGGPLGAAVLLGGGNADKVEFASNTIAGGGYGFKVAGHGAGFSLKVSSLTFQDLAPGATAINFGFGSFTSSFTAAAFNSPNIAININASQLYPGASVYMYAPYGPRAGTELTADPFGHVQWPWPAYQNVYSVFGSSASVSYGANGALGYVVLASTSDGYETRLSSASTFQGDAILGFTGLAYNTTYYLAAGALWDRTTYYYPTDLTPVTNIETPASVYFDEVGITTIVASAYAPTPAFSGLERGISGVAVTTGAAFDVWGSTGNYWTTKAAMPTARQNLSAGVLGGKLYAVGGYNVSYLNANEEYDPASNSWATKAVMPTVRGYLSAGVIGGKLYAVGGLDGSPLNTNEEYDPTSNSWATKAVMPTARRDFAAGVIGGKLYAVGGTNGSYLNINEEYDPVSDSWATKTVMPTPRSTLTAGVMGGKLYAVGGSNGTPMNTNEEYDPVSDSWATKAVKPAARWSLSAGVIGGKLYAVGGNNGGAKNTNEEYDPTSNSWATKAVMPTARYGLSASAIGGKLYVVGGFGGSKNENEVYAPGTASSFAGLQPNTLYDFKAKARNQAGAETPESATVSTYTLAAVGFPGGGQPFSGISAVALTVSWSSGSWATGWNGPGASYRVQASTMADYSGNRISSTTANLSHTFDLPANTSFFFRIQAYNSVGATDGSWLALGSTRTLMRTWPAIAGCSIVRNVDADGGSGYSRIQDAVHSIGSVIAADACVVIRDTATYTEQVTIRNINNFGVYRIKIMADPTYVSSAPVISPPALSTAAFHIINSSVSVLGINIAPAAALPYGIYASSAGLAVSSVNIVSGSFINAAGVTLAGYGSLSYSTVTVQAAQGVALSGSNNEVSFSTMSSASPAHSALYVSGSSNTVNAAHISNPAGQAVLVGYNSQHNTIIRSTMTSGASWCAALVINGPSNTVLDSYVQGSTAAHIAASTGSVLGGSVLIGAAGSGTGLLISSGSVNLSLSSSTLSGGASGAGIYLDVYNSGALTLSSNTITGGAYGLNIATQNAGTTLSISSITFASLSPGATAVNFLGGQFVSTFTRAAFNSANIAVNVNGGSLGSGSQILMRQPAGAKAGVLYENDPLGYVDWGLPAGCSIGFNVSQDGAGDHASVMAAVNALPASFGSDACVVIRDTQTYSEQVTVQGFTTNGFRLRIMADPTFVSSAPVINPPTASTAAFQIMNASVTVQGIKIISTNTATYGIYVSSSYAQLSSVAIVGGSSVSVAGVWVSSFATISGSTISVAYSPYALMLTGSSNTVAQSSITSNGYGASPYGGTTLPATVLAVYGSYNEVSQSTISGGNGNTPTSGVNGGSSIALMITGGAKNQILQSVIIPGGGGGGGNSPAGGYGVSGGGGGGGNNGGSAAGAGGNAYAVYLAQTSFNTLSQLMLVASGGTAGSTSNNAAGGGSSFGGGGGGYSGVGGNAYAIYLFQSSSNTLSGVNITASGGTGGAGGGPGGGGGGGSSFGGGGGGMAGNGGNAYVVYLAQSSSNTLSQITISASGGLGGIGAYAGGGGSSLSGGGNKEASGSGGNAYAVYLTQSSSNTLSQVVVTASGGTGGANAAGNNGGGGGAGGGSGGSYGGSGGNAYTFYISASNNNRILQSTAAIGAGTPGSGAQNGFSQTASLSLINASTNVISGIVLGGANGLVLDTNSGYNTIDLSSITSRAINSYYGYHSNGSYNTATQSHFSGYYGAVFSGSNARFNSISYSTMSSASGVGLYFNQASSNTVVNSYIQGSTAAYVFASTGTSIGGSVLVSTYTSGWGLWLSSGNHNLALSSSTLMGGVQGAGIYLDENNSGFINLSSNSISGGKYGLNIATQAAGATLSITSMTFSSLTAGATAINFLGGTFVSTFSGAGFYSGNIAVSVNANALGAGSRLIMRDYGGLRAGPFYANDSLNYVEWADSPGGVLISTGIYQQESLNNRNGMVRSSNGDLYLAYAKTYSGNSRLFLARSVDNGATWADTTSAPVDNSGCPATIGYAALAIDSKDVLHLAYTSGLPAGCDTGRIGVSSAAVPGTAWAPWQSVPGAYPYAGYSNIADIAVARDNSVHVVWGDQDMGAPGGYAYGWVVKYSSRAADGQAWSNYTRLPGAYGDGTAGMMQAALAIDGAGVLHVVSRQCGPTCGPDNGPFRIVYSSKSVYGGNWSGPATVADLTANSRNQEMPSLVVDSQNNLHAVWSGQDDTNTLNYQVKYASMNAGALAWGTWSNIAAIAPAPQQYPSLAVDAANDLHAVWTGTDTVSPAKNVKYSKFSGLAWSPWVNLTTGSYDQSFAIARWAGWRNNGGGLDVAWTAKYMAAYQLRSLRDPAVAMSGGFTDLIAPSAVTGFAAAAISAGSLSLSWIAPGNDGWGGTLDNSTFTIQYSTYPGVTWSTSAAQIIISTTGVEAGSARSYPLANLAANTSYYFRLWTNDDTGNYSAASNMPAAATLIETPTSVYVDEVTTTSVVASAYAPSPAFTGLERGVSGVAVTREAFFDVWNGTGNYWAGKADVITGRHGAGAAPLGGKIYVVGGYDVSQSVKNEVYDPAANLWETKTPMNYARRYLAVAAHGGKLYAIGGENSGIRNYNEEYNPEANSWIIKTVLPTARFGPVAASVGGKIHVIGGNNGSVSDKHHAYDPAANTWVTTTFLPDGREMMAAGVIGGKIYVVGGTDIGVSSKNEEFDPVLNSWSTKSPMPSARSGLGAAVIGGKLYAVGGFNGPDSAKNEAYDPVSDTWATMTDLPTPRRYPALGAVAGKLYAVGGIGGLAVNEEYTPGVARVFGGLSPNALYSFKAKARNQFGVETGESVTVSTYTLAFLDYPIGQHFGGVHVTSVTVRWASGNASVGYNGPGATYLVQASTTPGFSGVLVSSLAADSVSATLDLSANTTYYFRVQSYNAGGMTDYRWLILNSTVTNVNQPLPLPVTAVSTYTVTAAWGANGNAPDTRYTAQAASDAGFGAIAASSQTLNTWAGLGPLPVANTYYYLRVNAVNRNGAASGWVSLGSTATAVETPASVYFDEVGTNTIVVSGYAPGGAFTGLETDQAGVLVARNGTYAAWRSANRWTTRAAMPTVRNGFPVGVINGRLYAVGGANVANQLNKNEEYDPGTNVWTTRAVLPLARYHSGGGVVGGKFYVVGGNNGSAMVSNNDEYDPASGAWTSRAPMPTARYDMVSGVVGGRLFVIGGYNAGNLAVNEAYDPASNSWGTRAPMPQPRSYHGGGAIGGKIYAVGGFDGANCLATNEEYDAEADAWTTRAPMPTARMYPGVGAVGGKLYAVGGDVNPGRVAINEEYDPAVDAWTTRRPMTVARNYPGAAAAAGKLYVIGGWDGSYLNVNEEYDPGVASSFTALSPNTSYVFKAKARNALGVETGETVAVSTYTLAAVALPLGGQVFAGVYASSVAVAWSSGTAAGGFNGPGASFRVLASTAADFSGSIIASTTYNVDGLALEGLAPNTTYHLRVRAYNAGGMTDYTWLVLGSTVTRIETPSSVYIDEVGVGTITASAYAPGPAFTGLDRLGSGVAVTTGTTFDIWGSTGNYWTQKAGMPTARSGFATAVAGGKLYAIGALGSPYNQNEEYDPATNGWTPKAALPVGRYGPAAAAVGGKVYVTGGYSMGVIDYVASNDVYDPASNTWSSAKAMPGKRGWHVSGSIGGKVYIAGGSTGGGGDGTGAVYDPDSDSWASIAAMNMGRRDFAGAVVGNKLYVAGGPGISSAEVYDPGLNTWATVASMPAARGYLTGATAGGKFYAVAGYESAAYLDVNEVYDPQSNTWGTVAPVPGARYSAGAGAINGKVYVVGGTNGGNLNSLYEYSSAVERRLTGLKPNTQYTFKARARGQDGTMTGESASVSTYTLAAVALPGNGQTFWAVYASSAAVNWSSGTAALGWNGPGASFLVVASTSADYFGANASSYTYNVDGATLPLAVNTTYYFRVRAYNAGGMTDYSWLVLGSTVTRIETPSAIYADRVTTTSVIMAAYASGAAFSGLERGLSSVQFAKDGAYEAWGSSGNYWAAKAPLSANTAAAAAAALGGRVHVLGGWAGGAAFVAHEAYDPATNAWTARAALPTARHSLAAAVVGGKLYALGGAQGVSLLGVNEEYDPEADAWTTRAPLPTPRKSLAAAVVLDRLYALGGTNGSTLEQNEEYDPAHNTWSVKTPLPTARYGLAAAVLHGRLYAVGGAGGLAVNESYDPFANIWTTRTPLPTGRYDLAAVSAGGKLYALGGYNGAGVSLNEFYDPDANIWTSAAPLPAARYQLAAAAVKGQIHAVGGVYLNTNEAYVPGSARVFSGLLPNKQYAFKALARNQEGTATGESLTFSTYTLAAVALSTGATFTGVYPSSVTVAYSSGTDAGGYNGPGAFYEVEASTAADYTGALYLGGMSSPDDLYRVVDTLASNTTYHFRVQAYNAGGMSDYGWLSLGATVTHAITPNAAAEPFANVNQEGLDIRWGRGGNSEATAYRLQISSYSDFSLLRANTYPLYTSTTAVGGLTPNTTWFARVAAVSYSGVQTGYYVIGSTLTRMPQPSEVRFTAVSTRTVQTEAYSSYGFPNLAEGLSGVNQAVGGVYGAWQQAVTMNFSNLAPNTQYAFKAQARDQTGLETAESPVFSTYTLATVSLPQQGPLFSGVWLTSMTVNWSSGTVADGFNGPGADHHVSVAHDEGFTQIVNGAATYNRSWSAEGLWPNTTHYFRARAVNTALVANPDWLTLGSTSTLANAVPSASVFEVWPTTVTVAWSSLPPTPSSDTCEGYLVQASTAPDFSGVIKSSATADPARSVLTVLNLFAETTYYFRVGALNHNGAPNYALAGSTWTPSENIPPTIDDNELATDYAWYGALPARTYNIDFHDAGGSALENFQVRATTGPLETGTVNADWTDILSGIDADDYTANWPLTAGFWNLLADGTNYISVQVFDGSGNKDVLQDAFLVFKDTTPPVISETYGDQVWRSTHGFTMPLAFSDAHSKLDTAEAAIWSAPGRTGGELSPWVAVFSAADSLGQTVNLPMGGPVWDLLQSGTNYVSLRAWDYSVPVNTNTWTDAFVVLKDTVSPAAINTLAAVSGSTWTARALFNAPAEYPSGIDLFAVQYASYAVAWATSPVVNSTHVYVSTAGVTAGAGSAIGVEELAANTTCYFRAWARDQAGNWAGLSNAAAAATLAEVPVPVGGPQIYVTSATFAWAPVDSGGYALYAATASDFTGTQLSSATPAAAASALTLPGLAPNTLYYFRHASLNWSGAPNYAVPVAAYTLPIIPSSAAVYAAVSSVSVTVEWLSNGNGPETQYQVRVSSDELSILDSTMTLPSGAQPYAYTFEGLFPNTTYWFQVRAYGNGGDFSEMLLLGSTVTAPVPPVLTGYALWVSSADVAWSSNGNGAGTLYQAYLSTAANFTGALLSSSTGSAFAFNMGPTAPNTTYYLRLRAVSAATGMASPYVNAAGLGLAAAPAGIGAWTVGPNNVGIYWDADANPGGLGHTGWSADAALPAPLYGHAAAVAGDLLFITGGYDGASYKAAVWAAPLAADGTRGAWTQVRAMPAARSAHSAVALRGRLYIIGGYDGSAARAEVWSAPVSSYGALGAWTAETPLPQAVYAHAAVAGENTFCVMGGYNGGAVNNVWYTQVNTDGSLNAWAAGPALPEAVYSAAAAMSDWNIYLAGGYDGVTAKTAVRRSGIAAGGAPSGWALDTALPSGLYAHAMDFAPGALFVSGGNGGTLARTATLRAPVNPDGSIAGWYTGSALPAARQSHSMLLRGGRLIALGGYDGASAKSEGYYSAVTGTEFRLQVTGAPFTYTPWAPGGRHDTGSLLPDTYYTFRPIARSFAGVEAVGAVTFSTFTYAAQPSTAALSGVFISSIQANWLASDNHAAVRYQAQLSSDAAHTQLAFSSDTRNPYAVFEGLGDNYTYHARVRALNNGGVATAWTALGSTTTRANPALDFTLPALAVNFSGDNAWRAAAGTLYNIDFTDAGGAWLSAFQVRAATYPASADAGWTSVVTGVNAEAYSADWALPAGFFELLAPGTNYISVRVWDGNSNSSTTVDAFYVLKDTAAPVITDSQTGESAWRMDDGGAIYNADFEDNVSGLAAIEYSASPNQGSGDAAGLGWRPVAAVAAGLKLYADNWAVDFAALPNDATNYISVRARDLAGNTETITGIDVFKILKYVAGPETGLTNPSTGYHSTLVAIAGTANDARSHAAQGVEVSVREEASGKYWDGAGFLAASPAWHAAAGTATWTYVHGIPWAQAAAYRVVARSSDTSGNYSLAYATRTFTYDPASPVLALLEPPHGGTVNSAAVVGGTAYDLSGLAGLAIRFGRYSGYSWDFNLSTWTVSGSSAAVTAAANWSFTLPDLLRASLETGASYYYTLYAVDNAVPAMQTVFYTHQATFTFVDDTAPAAVSNFAASTGNAPGNISLTWSAPGDDAGAGMILYGQYRVQHATAADADFSTAAAQTAEDFTAAAAGSARGKELTGLTPGQVYYLHLWTRDDAGNWSALSNATTAQAAPFPDRISGRVMTVSSAGITGVLVEAFDSSGLLQKSGFTVNNGLGSYALAGLAAGSYRIQATWEAEDIISSVGSGNIALGASNADFILSISYELASIGGELAGYRIAGARARALGVRPPAASVELYQRGRLVATAPIDANGRFHIGNLLPGKYTMRVPDPEGGAKELSVRVKAGEALLISPLGELLKTDKVYVYPNPASRVATFHIETELSPVLKQLAIFDITGRLIAKLGNEAFVSRNGGLEAEWEIPSRVAPGVYVYSLHVKFEPTGEHKKVVKKFAIVK